jgi:methylmalonyl-CoA mutase
MVGVNRFKPEIEEDIQILKVDTAAVRARQIAKLDALRAERDSGQVQRALDSLMEGARGNANLLELAVEAARAKATVGEISFALEKVLGRHRAGIAAVSGVYARESGTSSQAIMRVKGLVEAFSENEGRRPRILVAKIGQDGHDRGQKVIASAFADLGFDVEIGPLFATPGEAARQAIENNVHIVGVSSLAAGHLTFVPQLRAALLSEGGANIMVVVGGVIPAQDFDALREAGVAAIFPPGTAIPEAAARLIELLNDRIGYRQKDVAE